MKRTLRVAGGSGNRRKGRRKEPYVIAILCDIRDSANRGHGHDWRNRKPDGQIQPQYQYSNITACEETRDLEVEENPSENNR